MKVPEQLRHDMELLTRVPLVSHRFRRKPLLRLARWFLRERKRADAEYLMRRCKTAFRANVAFGVSYRLCRMVQDERQKRRISRGKAWENRHDRETI